MIDTSFLTPHVLDMLTAALGLAYILLEYRASVWMWVVGFFMQLLGILLYYEKGLYADCGMEFYYLAMTVYGFYSWKVVPQKSETQILKSSNRPITHIPMRVARLWTMVFLSLWVLIYVLLVTLTDSRVPIADSFTTSLSLIGIWALARKYLEQWFVWIAVDVVTCALYFYKDIPWKASLYALYVVIAVFGYRRWKQQMASRAHI